MGWWGSGRRCRSGAVRSRPGRRGRPSRPCRRWATGRRSGSGPGRGPVRWAAGRPWGTGRRAARWRVRVRARSGVRRGRGTAGCAGVRARVGRAGGGAVALDRDDGTGGCDGHACAPVARGFAQVVDVHLDRQGLAGVQGARGLAEVEPGGGGGRGPAHRCVAGRGEGDQRGVAVVAGRHPQVPVPLAGARDAHDLDGDVGLSVLAEAGARGGAGVAGVLVAVAVVRGLAVQAAGVLRLGGAGRAAVLALDDRGASVGRPQGEDGGRHDGGDDGRGDGTRAQAVPAGRAVLGVHGEAAPVEAGAALRARGRCAIARCSAARGLPVRAVRPGSRWCRASGPGSRVRRCGGSGGSRPRAGPVRGGGPRSVRTGCRR